MPRVTLRVRSNPGLVALSDAFPAVPFDVLGAWPTPTGIRLLLEVGARALDGGEHDVGQAGEREAGDLEVRDLESSLADLEDVLEYEIRHAGPETMLFEVSTPRPPPHGAMAESGVVPEFPYRLQGGWLTGDLVATDERLAAFCDELGAAGIDYRVMRVTATPRPDRLLTDRQREMLGVAVEAGYYDVPRECTLTDVAERLGVNKSVASRVLHRAESRIVTDFWTVGTPDSHQPHG